MRMSGRMADRNIKSHPIPSPFAYVHEKKEWKIHENVKNYAEKIAETKKAYDSGKLKIKE